MVNHSSRALDRAFQALSDPTRRAILARIVKGDSTVGELAEPFNMSLAAVSKHLQVLERAKFVKKMKSGRVVTCRATLEPLGEMTALLEELGRYWNRQLDSLEAFLATELTNKEEQNGKQGGESSAGARRSTSRSRKKR
ncbi:MAG: winged helix-turn-helix transcriptional regulator [Deltaproteobacteria bacterium]|nr:winged helix-turn-helix transcriptional regulator [Deltaproteobacteria bacterium]